MVTNTCAHSGVTCLNEYEIIRKYRCNACNGVMMCACDEYRGQRFLPHQLAVGTELKTQERVPVTHGFQQGVCRECRGLPPIPAPMAAIHGRTTKIKRFYWREITFREFEILETRGASMDDFLFSGDANLQRQVQEQALNDIKALHEKTPKYALKTESEAEFLARVNPEVVEVRAQVRLGGEVLRDDGSYGRPEVFAADWLVKRGYLSFECESRPLHVLFAVLLWPLIQDSSDSLTREMMFGERASFEKPRQEIEKIVTRLPKDFGTAAYSERRAAEIDLFFDRQLPNERNQLLFAFDARLEGSYGLRQYLWAHEKPDVERARRLLSVILPVFVHRVLRYLLEDYWQHYLGWPDMFASRGDEFFFLEVKLSKDKLSEAQRTWIGHNATTLKLPFKILKIHRISE